MRIYKIARIGSRILDKFLADGTITGGTLRTPNLFITLELLRDLGDNEIKDTTYAAFESAARPRYPNYDALMANIAILDSVKGGVTERQLLYPFNAILSLIATKYSGAGGGTVSSLSDLNADIITILNYSAGETEIRTSQEIQGPMFLKLYNGFKTEITNAAKAIGNKDLENAINSDGLVNPGLLREKYKLGDPQSIMYEISYKLINEIMSSKYDSIKFANQNFEKIKKSFMEQFGVIKYQEIKERKKQEFLNTPLYEGTTTTTTTPYNATAQQLTNPHFLTALLIFFMEYNKKLLKLPPKL